jgi:hypothetical protein
LFLHKLCSLMLVQLFRNTQEFIIFRTSTSNIEKLCAFLGQYYRGISMYSVRRFKILIQNLPLEFLNNSNFHIFVYNNTRFPQF